MQKFFVFIVVVISIVVAISSEPNSIDQLYDNLLQREDIGQIGFPGHEVERKAQRSPSLRLRFGRSDPTLLKTRIGRADSTALRARVVRADPTALRSRIGRADPSALRSRVGRADPSALRTRVVRADPTSLRARVGRSNDMNSPVKRYYNWFGDVNQKPIRSPSLRLRFGRRSDPSMPMHGPHFDPDMDDTISPNDLLPLSDVSSVQILLEALRKIEAENSNSYFDNTDDENSELYDTRNTIEEQLENNQNYDDEEFDRETRKPKNQQLRLRWGRSIGNIPSVKYMNNNQEQLMASMDNNNSFENEINETNSSSPILTSDTKISSAVETSTAHQN